MQFALPVLIALLAQNPPGGMSVHELLASNDSAQLAWGAEMAARSGPEDYVPELRRLLAWTDDRVKEQALDALIRVKAKVPPEELTPLPPVFQSQVIILAIRNGNSGILASMLAEDPQHDATWVALNEGLIQHGGAPAYWSKLLREWTIHVVIYVVDPGKTPVLGPQAGSYFCGDGYHQDRPGFPPRAAYGLFIDPQLDDTALLTRPKPVFYRRHSSSSGCDTPIDRNEYRGDFIAFAANVYPPLQTHYRYDVAWADDQSYAAGVDRLRRDLLADYQRMLDGMVKRRLLPPEDSALRPHIVVGIEDQRSSKDHDLPASLPWE
jgi:hypothetical protein